MNIFWLVILFIIMTGLIVLTVELLIPRWIVKLAKKDVWWSPYRLLPPPGEMFIIVKGDRAGPFDSVLESVLTHEFNHETNEFVKPQNKPKEREGYLSDLGVAWVGFFRSLLHREVRHDKWENLPGSTEFGIVSKTRPGPSIFFRYNMAVEIKAAETVGNFPIDAVIVFTVEIINPVEAFFFAGGWEAQTAAAVSGKVRKYVSDKTIDKLRTEHTSGKTSLVDEIKSLGGRDSAGTGNHKEDGLYILFGIEITDARFVLFDLVKGEKEMSQAIIALEIATLEAEADKKRGEGEKNLRTERAKGIAAEVAAWGSNPVGGQVAMAEAIKEAKPNVIGGGIVTAVSDKG